jgi:uncharacterized protein (TIGR03437 family)
VNQDGTVNSASNPAKLGFVVAIWVTGVGGTVLQVQGRSPMRAGLTTFGAFLLVV